MRKSFILFMSAVFLLNIFGATSRAFDLTSYINATVNYSKAGTLKDLIEIEDCEANHEKCEKLQKQRDSRINKGTAWLFAGLSLDIIGLVLITSSGSSYNCIEGIRSELANSGGPIVDSFAVGQGVSSNNVLKTLNKSHNYLFGYNGTTLNKSDFDFIRSLSGQLELTNDDAGRILYSLYQERVLVGSSKAVWHEKLSILTAVSIKDLAPTIADVIDSFLRQAIIPGKIVSARRVLAENSKDKLNSLLDTICDQHPDFQLAFEKLL